MKKVLFIDRDGTLLLEPPVTFQIDSLEKLEFYPGVLRNMYNIRQYLEYELVIVSNQDGMGTSVYPYESFIKPHEKFLQTFKNEGVIFDDILIDQGAKGQAARSVADASWRMHEVPPLAQQGIREAATGLRGNPGIRSESARNSRRHWQHEELP